MKHVFFFIFLNIAAIMLFSQVPAFEGAEGFGMYASGGRGGRVVYVSTLEDNGSPTLTGSLRWALSQPSPKTILFSVSGTIHLASKLSIAPGNVTIAGQSAPGDGICIAGEPVTISADNVIIRFVRFRMGDRDPSNGDGADALGARRCKNIIIDHCSMSWSTDECVSIYENENTTLQWCLISESLRLSTHSKGPHGYGGIWGGKNASFHHNLLAHHDSRTPRFGPGSQTQTEELTDMRNNVIYNASGNGCYGAEAMNINIVNNYYKPGPASPSGSKRARIVAIDKKTGLSSSDSFYPINNTWGQYFIDGNYIDASTSSRSDDIVHCNNASTDNWIYGVYNQIADKYSISADEKAALKRNEPFEFGRVTTHTAETACQKVLAYAGCSHVRDEYDLRIVDETRKGTAAFIGLSEFNGLGNVTYPAGTVIGSETLSTTTTINWKSTDYPKWGIIDSQNDLKPQDAGTDWSPWPVLHAGTAPTDSDSDGMPDVWENERNLNSHNPDDGPALTLDSAYTNLEVYLNELVQDIVSNQNTQDGPSSLDRKRKTTQSNLIVLPNPASSMLFIHSETPIVSLHILNMQGRVIQERKPFSTSSSFAVNHLPQSLYLIKTLDEKNRMEVQKIRIMHE
ncbi:MAG TPA: right-handed parallel beta-helix repeat-containing protein [Prolixibacteraceae bacterium]|nr:right-handed parallel beta-helix repeat-containing protein [Prolixibacteraceae bacterium]